MRLFIKHVLFIKTLLIYLCSGTRAHFRSK